MIEIELILAGVLAVILIAILLIGRSRRAKAKQLRQEREVVAEAERRRVEAEKEQRRQAKEAVKVEAEAAAPVEAKVTESAKAVAEEKIHPNLPQDSMLRRHYLTHLKMMIETVYAPAPSDSALKRHHQNMIDSTIENCLDDDAKMVRLVADYEAIRNTSKQPVAEKVVARPEKVEAAAPVPSKPKLNLPEDSMLKRHYLTHVRSMIETVHGPRPTDSTLKRHYDSMVAFELEDCLCCDNTLAKLECSYKEARQQQAVAAKARPAVVKAETVVSKSPEPTVVKQVGGKVSIIPEDSMLRRHHLTHVRSLVEVEKGPRPTDFNLRRHYDTMIDSELDRYIEEAEAA